MLVANGEVSVDALCKVTPTVTRKISFVKNAKVYNSNGSRFSEPHAGQLYIAFSPTSLLKMQPQSVHTLRSALTIIGETIHRF